MNTLKSRIHLGTFLLIILTSVGCDSTAVPSDEESATQLQQNETYDQTRAGARLVMAYDTASNSFFGTVENTTSSPLAEVRVEIHLSNGTELGPTPSLPLAVGETINVTLQATTAAFATWSAHPEVGPQGSGGEGGGEHGGSGGEGGGN